jgi:prenyltransferase beta subunit
VPNKDKVVSNILACKNSDGGFGNYPQNPSYLETLFYASVALSLLDETSAVKEDTIKYILEAHFADGGFGEQGSMCSNLFNTFYAVISLKVFNRINSSIRDDVIRYLDAKIIHDDEIYDEHVGMMNSTSMFWVAGICQSLSFRNLVLRDKMVSFCMSCFNDEAGLFSAVPNGIPTIQNTYECLVILKEYSALNLINETIVYEAIMKRKKEAFFLDDLLKYHTFSTSMWAILCLNVLGCLNKLENADVLSFAAATFTNSHSIYDSFCAVNVITNIIYNSGSIRTEKSFIQRELGTTASFKTLKSLINNMQRSGIDYLDYDFILLLSQSKAEDIKTSDSFMQISLNEGANRLYEIEVDENSGMVLSLIIPISRVTGECISKHIISANKVKLLGVFDTESNLLFSRQEEQILDKYCKDNKLYKYTALVGQEAEFENIKSKINKNYHIFYYSGHCQNGNLCFAGREVKIDDVIDVLVENHCAIVILNSCNSYEHIKNYYNKHKYINTSLNVICTLNDISDEQAMTFMTSLFRYLELGYPISEAVRSTKFDLYIEYKGLGNIWWSYLLFGNPYTIIDSQLMDNF